MIMRRILLALSAALTVVSFCPRLAFAGATTNPVNIIAIDVRADGKFIIDISQPMSGSPACAVTITRVSGNSNTIGGKALLQASVSYFLSGKQVIVDGTGTCTEYPTIESIANLHFPNQTLP